MVALDDRLAARQDTHDRVSAHSDTSRLRGQIAAHLTIMEAQLRSAEVRVQHPSIRGAIASHGRLHHAYVAGCTLHLHDSAPGSRVVLHRAVVEQNIELTEGQTDHAAQQLGMVPKHRAPTTNAHVHRSAEHEHHATRIVGHVVDHSTGLVQEKGRMARLAVCNSAPVCHIGAKGAGGGVDVELLSHIHRGDGPTLGPIGRELRRAGCNEDTALGTGDHATFNSCAVPNNLAA
mmetsp:Transcript_6500/g.24157  ORF Transcript_6500/g.24157 Transcript_6500/m.24157 type:complete len:233 (+) Transcript_6500:2004-2702(+)